MDNIYVYVVPLPYKTKEAVMPCMDGYTVYINSELDEAARLKAYEHALGHIQRNDWEKADVQIIETVAHSQTDTEAAGTILKPKPKKSKLAAYLKRMERRAKALAKIGVYEEVEFVDGEYGEPVARRIAKMEGAI